MTRFRRKHIELTVARIMSKYAITWIVLLAFLLVLSLFSRSLSARSSSYHLQIFPLNELERGYVSRQATLRQLKEFIYQIRTYGYPAVLEEGKLSQANHTDSRFLRQITKDISVLQGLGLHTLCEDLTVLSGKELPGENIEESSGSFPENSSDITARSFITHRFCYENTWTPQGNHRQVDPSFCSRLINLFNDIQQGLEPPLLTLFTWFPDPLSDFDKHGRRVLFQNWELFRPIVQPVLLSDSRIYMSLANSFGWPCLPVSKYSSEGVPVFKDALKIVSARFNSTFYGYVRANTVFDASMVETLLKIKELYIDKNVGGKLNKNYQQSNPTFKPLLVYGRALRANQIGNMKELQHISERVNASESRIWEDRKDSLVYFFYSRVDFSDIPDLILDDKYLTSQIVSRSMALDHLVVDASATIFSVHLFREKALSEWGREYVQAKPRDLYFNKRLGANYFHSLGKRKPTKWLNEVATRYSKSGIIYIDLRHDASV